MNTSRYDGTLRNWESNFRKTGSFVIRRTSVYQDHIQDVIRELKETDNYIKKCSVESLEFMWRVRDSLKASNPYGKFKLVYMIKEEIEARWDGARMDPTEIRIPFFEQLDPTKLKALILDKIENQTWPGFIKTWMKRNVKIITESPKTIEDTLINVNMPWCPKGCSCAQIQSRFKAPLPTINGHIFCIGREYEGPHKTVSSSNRSRKYA